MFRLFKACLLVLFLISTTTVVNSETSWITKKSDKSKQEIKLEKKSCLLCAPTTLRLYISHLRFLSSVSCQNTQNGLTHSNIVQLIYQARFITIDQFPKTIKKYFFYWLPQF